MTTQPRRIGSLEVLENRRILAADVIGSADLGMLDAPAEPEFFVADSFSFGVEREMKESGEKGGTADINIGVGELQECTISKSIDQAGSFSFGVEREMKESGEKGGTTDMNIGVGELQECTISKSMDQASSNMGALDLAFADLGAEGSHRPWSISGDADDRPTEEVAFYYNKIAFAYSPTRD